MEEQQQQRAYALGEPRAIRITRSDGMPLYVNTQWIKHVEPDPLVKNLSHIHLLGGDRISAGMSLEDVLALWGGRG